MKFFIGDYEISKNSKTIIVAEISANHNSNLSNVYKLIKKAKKSGADLVKIQCYDANDITINSNKKDFKINTQSPWSDYKNLWTLYNKASTSASWMQKIFSFANKENITLFASVFDLANVDLLEKFNVPAYKIASPEINHIPLLERVALTKKPILLSTGVATRKEIEVAINIIKKYKNNKIILMKCTSSYPASIEEANIKTIKDYSKSFNVYTGLSDHTISNYTSLASVCFGVKIIEKHFSLENIKSPDSFFSLKPKDFKNLVHEVRNIEKSIGNINYNIAQSTKANTISKRSIYIFRDVKKNDLVTQLNIKVIRPGYSLHPKYYKKILNMKFKKNLSKGSRLSLRDLKK